MLSAGLLIVLNWCLIGGGGWPNAPDGPYAWGYCFVTERDKSNNYCEISKAPCASGKSYYGRGPLQLTQ